MVGASHSPRPGRRSFSPTVPHTAVPYDAHTVLCLARGVLYAVTEADPGEIAVFDLDDGRRLFTQKIDTRAAVASVLALDRRVIVAVCPALEVPTLWAFE